MNKKLNVLYVYGTLRPNLKPLQVKIPGLLYNIGWYPGAKLGSPRDGFWFLAERVEVTDEELTQIDRYEGYHPSMPTHSLFRRVPYMDGEIYVYNQPTDDFKYVEPNHPNGSADWLKFKRMDHTSGSASDMLGVQPRSTVPSLVQSEKPIEATVVSSEEVKELAV